MRNSSLVQEFRAENVTGLKRGTETLDLAETLSGRGALCWRRSDVARRRGAYTRENAGISTRKDK